MNQLKKQDMRKNKLKNKFQGISTCMGEFQPGNKTIYVVFDEESEFSGPRTPKLRPDQVFEEKRTLKNLNLSIGICYIHGFLAITRYPGHY